MPEKGVVGVQKGRYSTKCKVRARRKVQGADVRGDAVYLKALSEWGESAYVLQKCARSQAL